MILNAAIMNGALELLPQSLASMAIIPLQMKLVYRIGTEYGYELDRGHVKDLLAILRFAENPRDRVSGFRVLQLMPGIGEVTAEDILDKLETMVVAASLAAVEGGLVVAVAQLQFPL